MTSTSQTANALARAIKYCGKNQREIAEEIGFPNRQHLVRPARSSIKRMQRRQTP